jgi:tetratricopeptide (TPR) repeat protein
MPFLGRWDLLATLLADDTFVRQRCQDGLIRELVASLRDPAQNAPHRLEPVVTALLQALPEQSSESFHQEFRGVLQEFFGHSPGWPPALRDGLRQSDVPGLILFLGNTLDMERRYREAEEVFRQGREQFHAEDDPAYAILSIRLAIVYDHQDRLDEALAVLQSLTEPPEQESCYGANYWWARYQLGVVRRRQGSFKEATAVFQQVHAAGSSHRAGALHQLGVVALEQRAFDEAERLFHRFLGQLEDRDTGEIVLDGATQRGEIEWAVTGQPLLWEGEVPSLLAQAALTYDLRHVWRLRWEDWQQDPRAHEAHTRLMEAFLDGLARPVEERAAALGRIAEEYGLQPEDSYLHSSLGITEQGDLLLLMQQGSLEELGRVQRALGACRAILLDNGGSVGVACWSPRTWEQSGWEGVCQHPTYLGNGWYFRPQGHAALVVEVSQGIAERAFAAAPPAPPR